MHLYTVFLHHLIEFLMFWEVFGIGWLVVLSYNEVDGVILWLCVVFIYKGCCSII